MKMKKNEMIKLFAENLGMTQKDTREILAKLQGVVFEEMAKGNELSVFDGVVLSGVHKEASVARNPQTGEPINVPAKMVPRCKFGVACKAAVMGE